MRSTRLAGPAAILVFVIGVALASGSAFGFPVLDLFKKDPILVVLVGSPRHVELVRRAIAPERIIVDTPTAFATTEERVIAVDADAAGEPINQAGWIDREIEIVAVPMDSGRKWERSRRSGSTKLSDEDRQKVERIADLMNKPTLNPLEATLLLQHMDRTGQF